MYIVERAAHPIFDDLVGVLEETAAALRESDLGQAGRALQKAREMDGRMDALREALDAGYDTVGLSPPRRRASGLDSTESLEALRKAANRTTQEPTDQTI